MLRRGWRALALLALVFGALLTVVAPTSAVLVGVQPRAQSRLRAATNTQIVLSRTGSGRGVTGFIADPSNPFDPVREGYPAGNPTSGFTPKNESFAGIIHARPTGGGAELSLYCIDIETSTYIGAGYGLGTWDSANVPNVGYVARLLDDYYPSTGEPSSLGNLDEKAAAVQAAIWFFSDRYVLSTSDRLRGTVAAIVDHVIALGPLVEPPPPSLALAPSHLSGRAGSVIGPFTLTTDVREATVTATGGSMFSDPAGTAPIRDGATVPSGQRIWVRSAGPSVVVLQATSEATVPTGNVYLYSGNTGLSDAQKVILAHTATLTTTVQATAEFLPPGSLVVRKTIAGPAAGSQGSVVIAVACDDGVTRPDLKIPARAPAGTTSHTYGGIPAGAVCTVTETSDGSVAGIQVLVGGDGREVTIPSGSTETVEITDTYHFVGSLLVRKTIAGPAAGRQGEVVIHTVCNGTTLTPDVVIGAGAPAGDQTKQYDDIAVPSTCTVTETADGQTGTVSVVVEGSGQTVSIPPGEVVEADISDTYGLVPGQLELTKTITGPLAGQQGPVVLHTVCNGAALSPDFVIPAGAPSGDYSQIYSGIPTPASCVVSETANGATSTVSAAVAGSGQTVAIAPGAAAAAHLTDTFGPAPGSLLVTKTIAGPLAGQQGQVAIGVVCDGVALSPGFLIAAGTPAGSVSHSFDGIPAGSACTVSETEDGATATTAAEVSGNGQVASIAAGKVASVEVIDVYQRDLGVLNDQFQAPPGDLKVTKTIAGPAAGRQGRIAILVACGAPLENFAFLIPARTAAGSVSRYFPGLPAGTRCTVTETADGHAAGVHASPSATHVQVTVPASGTAAAHLTDVYTGAAHVTG